MLILVQSSKAIKDFRLTVVFWFHLKSCFWGFANSNSSFLFPSLLTCMFFPSLFWPVYNFVLTLFFLSGLRSWFAFGLTWFYLIVGFCRLRILSQSSYLLFEIYLWKNLLVWDPPLDYSFSLTFIFEEFWT